jgi:hypothetical protein
MPAFKFHGNFPTILAYAWICSRQDLRAAVLPDERETWPRKNGEAVVRSLIEQEVAPLEAESPYGRLLRLETATIDCLTIDATLRESSAIYFSALQEEQQEEGNDLASLATDIILAWLEHDSQLAWLLTALGEVHRDNQISRAHVLSLFFQRQSQLALRTRSFFVRECVRLALERVRWGRVAERLPAFPSVHHLAALVNGLAPNQIDDASLAQAILFPAMLRQAGLEFNEWAAQPAISEDSRALAHYLADFCRQSVEVVACPASQCAE